MKIRTVPLVEYSPATKLPNFIVVAAAFLLEFVEELTVFTEIAVGVESFAAGWFAAPSLAQIKVKLRL